MSTPRDFGVVLLLIAFLACIFVAIRRARNVGDSRQALSLSVGYYIAFGVFVIYTVRTTGVARAMEIIATIIISFVLIASIPIGIMRRLNSRQ